MSTFSLRHGYTSVDAPITVREDAPADLRFAVVEIARRKCEMSPGSLRDIVCGVLFVMPDGGNWSPYPNIWDEVQQLLSSCPWHSVYDIAEEIWRSLHMKGSEHELQDIYLNELNRFFVTRGIGWRLDEEQGIVFRGDVGFERGTGGTVDALVKAGRTTAAEEVREALRDLSRKPPDLTGAVQHSIAALECTARDILGSKDTLGALIRRLKLEAPLDTAIEKLWAFASNNARHLREGNRLRTEEVALLVVVACAVCEYLVSRSPPDDDL